MSKEKEKNCSKCDKTLRFTYHKTCCCERKFCYSCILSYFEENLKISGFPIKCPILSCESFLGFDLVQEALKPEDFDNLMKDLRLCSGCMNYKPKHSMAKTGDCAHKKCEECEINNKKCHICLRKKFNKNKESISLKKSESLEGKKRTCVICGEKSKKYKKFTCCSKVICLGCLRNSLGKRLKRVEKASDSKDFILKCPNCKNRLEENEILEDLDEEQQKMYNSIMKRKKCRICKVYKEANDDIWKLEACKHKICRNCLKDYLKISVFSKNAKMSNIICPVRQCHHLISLAQFKNMDDFKEINEQISKKEKEDYEEEKNLEKPNLSQKITCFEDLRHDNCEICAYDCEIVDMITLECEHRFCKNCILKYLKMKLNEGLITENHMICPREGCKISINYNILKVNLPKDLFEKYDTLLFKYTVKNKF